MLQRLRHPPAFPLSWSWPLFILINVFQSYSWCVPSLMRAAVRVVGQADVSSCNYVGIVYDGVWLWRRSFVSACADLVITNMVW